MRIVWGAIFAFVLSTTAFAQETEVDAKAKADAMIAAADAADLFTNVTADDGKMAIVRHNATGLQCTALPVQKARIIVLTAVMPRGDDVICEVSGLGFTISYYATRAPQMTVKREMRMATDAIRLRWAKARRYKPSGDSAKFIPRLAEPSPLPYETAWFAVADEEGHPLVTRVSIAHAGEWTIKMRATGSPMDPGFELLTDMLWREVLEDVSPPDA